ncbi:Xaa-Pro aminopeptidase [Thalassotalea sp. LPB0316]|uniref:Xaa-Pro aminopeptidase n=1 Tax=Thalassotalea sp. LPB0316 TaxID=2769490 RepID=UPI001867AD2D|nr:Xaa-Pro aminopeptidase [Thalassotalea sp. LPB0316]QOL27349.1 Xaa-Pro aminopeptidase [Thalassotalea sp. LPB0316]
MIDIQEFVARRACFIDQMDLNSIAIFCAADELTRSHDTEFPFCQNKNFLYLTGFNEPQALLVLTKDALGNGQSTLFCRDKDPLQEVWHGRRVGAELAKEKYAFDQTFTLEQADEQIVAMLKHKSSLYTVHNENDAFDSQIFDWLSAVKSGVKAGDKAPSQLIDCSGMLAEMRLIKSQAELAVMRKANEITANAHVRAMKNCQVGMFEYQIEAEVHHEFAFNGARHPAYGSIVAGGDNANILHYTDNSDVLKDNELLLIDAGGELDGYASDITRTFPINGKFTPAQKEIYQLVLDAQIASIEAIKPGVSFAQLNDIVHEVFTKGLVELGILQGDFDTLMEEKACKQYFIHGLGHWLGLDVHDVGDYDIDENRRQNRAFEPGMIMTIEPGLYIPLDAEVDDKYKGIGVRIEDNVVVTENGYENYSLGVPKTIADIEALMAS